MIGKLLQARDALKKQAIVSIDRLIENSSYVEHRDENSHQWLDMYGWDVRKSYLWSDDGVVYPVALKIAKTKDGRNILYDVRVEKEEGVAVDQVATSKLGKLSSMAGVKSTTPSMSNIISQFSGIVKGKVFFDDSVELSELTKKQRAEVEYAGNEISAAIGNEIHFFESRHAPADSRKRGGQRLGRRRGIQS